jgi:hypothetical protein
MSFNGVRRLFFQFLAHQSQRSAEHHLSVGEWWQGWARAFRQRMRNY